MSVEACTTFLRASTHSDELKQQMKAVTDPKEIIALGKSYGYTFNMQDIIAASTSFDGENATSGPHAPAPAHSHLTSAFYHYEFDLDQIPGFEEVGRALQHLKIKPATVNLGLYEKSYREDDFQFTSMSPAAPEFAQRYQSIMQAHWQDSLSGSDFSRRDFHLVNLDQHVEHALYEQYFQAKMRVIASLETFFGCEIRFSGSMWYPPFAYRLWHTNETQTGWRMYVIDFDESVEQPKGTSFFRYMNPQSKEVVTLEERPKLVRFFKIEQEKEKLFWHCIVNATTRSRWSFGFIVPDHWMDKFPHLAKH